MRLSNLIKNKHGVSSPGPQGETTADKQDTPFDSSQEEPFDPPEAKRSQNRVSGKPLKSSHSFASPAVPTDAKSTASAKGQGKIRLSDLIKNKHRVSSPGPQGETTADKQDNRPSEKPVREKPPESKDSPRQATEHPGNAQARQNDKTPQINEPSSAKATDDLLSSRPSGKQRDTLRQDTLTQESSEPSASPAVPTDAKSTEIAPRYSTLPSGIYNAAEQLKIAIPQNLELVLQNARTLLSKIFARASDPADDKKGLWEITQKISNDLLNSLPNDLNFMQVIQFCDEIKPLINHSINTAIVTINLARNLNKAEYSPQEIGAAALLHNIGIATLGLDFPYSKNDLVYIKHIAKSVEIAKQMKAPEIIRTMIAQHHERIDGSGYPAGISGNEFLVSSQILSLSSNALYILCERYQGKQSQNAPEQNYVQIILMKFRKAFDADILKTFISLFGFYPNNSIVELTNRSICRVIKQNKNFPLKPVVQVVMDGTGNHPENSKIIDLHINISLAVMRSISYNPCDKQPK